MKIEFSFPFTEQELNEALVAREKGDPKPLRFLCRKEVQCFNDTLRDHPDYRDGLVLIERRVVEGYLYQKIKGRIHENPSNDPSTKERPNGT